MKILSALKYTAALCLAAAMSGLSVSPETLFSYEFPKDYTEEQNFYEDFTVRNGFHTCISDGKLSSISSFGVPVRIISPDFDAVGADYFVFSLQCGYFEQSITLKVTFTMTDGSTQTSEIKLSGRNTNVYALKLPETEKITKFEIFPDIQADMMEMYNVDLDFARFESTKTLVFLKIGDNNLFADGVYKDTDAPAVIDSGRTLTPARYVAEALGAQVEWDEESKRVTVKKDDTVITLFVGKEHAFVNGKEVELDCPAKIIGNRTYTPARFVAENLGYSVSWDDNSKTVIVTDQ